MINLGGAETLYDVPVCFAKEGVSLRNVSAAPIQLGHLGMGLGKYAYVSAK